MNHPIPASPLPRFSFDPLDDQDRALLARRNVAFNDPTARSVVKLGRLQRWLVSRGYLLFVDGRYGPPTDRAVRSEKLVDHLEDVADPLARSWARFAHACWIISGAGR